MFKYFGSKLRLADRYPPPRFGTIVEPFAGSAAYAVRHRRNVDRVVLIEADKRIADLWERLLAMSADDLLSLPAPVQGERSGEILYALAAGRTTRDTPESFIVSPRMAQRFRPMIRRMASVIDECRHFEIVNGDFTVAPDVEATWFIDPPYQPTAGRWDRTRGGRYLHSNQGIDYEHLGAWAAARRGQVIVCEQSGATWMPWTNTVVHRSGTHDAYHEVWWTNEESDSLT